MSEQNEGIWIRSQHGIYTYIGWWKEFYAEETMVILRDRRGKEFLVGQCETEAGAKKLNSALYHAIAEGEFLFDASKAS